MLNFQVHNLNETMKHLEQITVLLAKKKEISEFGKFILNEVPEGRLVELGRNNGINIKIRTGIP